MIQVLFVIIAAVGLAAALGTILARNLVRAALYLVAFFFTIACQFVLLEAEFLAALQVLVYIGAVAIILMFGIMLTRNIQGDDPSSTPSAWQLPGLVAGLAGFLVLAFGITYQKANRRAQVVGDHRRVGRASSWRGPTQHRPGREAINNMAKVVGNELMTRYVIAFEVAGLLLTAALVGAIASRIARRSSRKPARGPAPTGLDAGSPSSNGPEAAGTLVAAQPAGTAAST